MTTGKFDPVGCAIKVDGSSFCWGDAVSGVAPGANTTVPTLVEGGITWQQIQTGGQLSCSCGIASDGAAYCWGFLFDPTTSVPSPDVEESDDYGAPVDPLSGTFDAPFPTEIEASGTWQDITASGSNYHVCGITTNGTALCWGSGHLGATGDGTFTYKSLPVPVTSVGVNNWTQITAGEVHSCGLQTDGSAWCWGSNDVGEIGDGTTENKAVPTQVGGGDTWIQLSAGGHFTCGLTINGIIKCWGCFDYDGTSCMRGKVQLTPTAVPGNTTWRQVSAGVTHACGIDAKYEAHCFGVNLFGELGGETVTTFSAEPVKVVGGYSWKEVSAGLYMSCGLTQDSQVLCWGQNNDGQLGSSGRETSVPRAVADPGPWGLSPEASKYLPKPDIPEDDDESSQNEPEGAPETSNSGGGGGGGSSAGSIAGGVIGGLAAIALIGAGVFFWRRRRATQQQGKTEIAADSAVATAVIVAGEETPPKASSEDKNSEPKDSPEKV